MGVERPSGHPLVVLHHVDELSRRTVSLPAEHLYGRVVVNELIAITAFRLCYDFCGGAEAGVVGHNQILSRLLQLWPGGIGAEGGRLAQGGQIPGLPVYPVTKDPPSAAGEFTGQHTGLVIHEQKIACPV